MSLRYKGGVLSATPPTTSSSAAPGIWTLEQQLQATAGTGWPFGGPFTYIEDVFSTYLYTGTAANQTITNGIDLSTKGGLVWLKGRSAVGNNWTQDTDRGVNSVLYPNLTNAAGNPAGTAVSAFNTTGFSLGSNTNINNSGDTYVSWTFRKQPKFFDIVTYTGNGAASRSISHSLGSKPGFVVIKRTDTTSDWWVAAWTGTTFRIGTDAAPFALNSTNAYDTQNGAAATSTTFDPNEVTLSSSYGVTPSAANTNGGTYVAYLFAHNAGGFGLSGNDNVISCGSFAGGSSVTVTLGYEPQWLLVKKTNGAQNWFLMDTMRGFTASQGDVALSPNTTGAEPTASSNFNITSTGFVNAGLGTGSDTYIYIAIRRGPMKVPTTGTSVFSPQVSAATTGTKVTTGFPVDAQIVDYRASPAGVFLDRLRGVSTNATASGQYLKTTATNAETTVATASLGWDNTGFQINAGWSGADTVYYNFQRAPSFFDEVCYTGTGSATTFSHNLGAVPELMIVKCRSSADDWYVYSASLALTEFLLLDTTQAKQSGTLWNTAPTASVFGLGSAGNVNASGFTYIAYLFATCAGVSKVGSYTGTGALQTVNCGFTSGARFVLIKRTDSTGDWYVYDSARGISASTDPYLFINSTAAEVTGTNYVDTDTTGFKVTAAAPAGLNANGGTYIFLAIA